MPSKTRILLTIAILPFLTACGSDNESPVNQDAADLNGEYNIVATSTTVFDVNGGTCGDATGTMTVTENEISGSVLSTNGVSLDIEGTISDDGNVVGGFAQGGNTIANFTGNISGTTGNGGWEDNFQCTGTWTAEQN